MSDLHADSDSNELGRVYNNTDQANLDLLSFAGPVQQSAPKPDRLLELKEEYKSIDLNDMNCRDDFNRAIMQLDFPRYLTNPSRTMQDIAEGLLYRAYQSNPALTETLLSEKLERLSTSDGQLLLYIAMKAKLAESRARAKF